MSWGRRTTALLVLAATGPLLVGCGGEPEQAGPEPIVIPGSTVTIGAGSSVPDTSEPETDPAEGAVETSGELLTALGAAISEVDSVHVSTIVGDVDVETDHQVVTGTDYTGELTVNGATIQIRRVGTTLYVEAAPGEPFESYTDGDEVAEGNMSPGYLEWDVLADLRNALSKATDFEAEDSQSYRWTVRWAAVDSSPNISGDGEAEVTLEVDDDGLPVRLELADPLGGADPVSFDYSDWGAPVTVEVPDDLG